LVYELANWRNEVDPIIAQEVIDRVPSAELKPDQTDQEHLPDYAVLDAIMYLYMEENAPFEKILQQGFEKQDVVKVIQWITQNEYKRKQGPIGPSLTTRSFGECWSYPITNAFREF
jgi:NAD+ synthase (glutamine-hydrolysing)